MAQTITVNTNGVVFVKGQRYMTNTATRDKHGKSPVFPYSEVRIKSCPSMKEIFPEFPEDAPEVEAVEETAQEMAVDDTPVAEKPSLKLETPAFSLEETMVIENPVVAAAKPKPEAPKKKWTEMNAEERAAYQAAKKGA